MACVRGKTCPECKGKKHINGEKCFRCEGVGKIADHRPVALHPGWYVSDLDFKCGHGCGYWSNNDGYGAAGTGPYPD